MRYFFIVISIAFLFTACKQRVVRQPLNQTGKVIPVKLAGIESDTGRIAIEASGIITTEEQSKLSFKIGGVIDRILVKEGQLVRKGQLLASLKSAEITAQVEQVNLAYQKAMRDYQRSENLFRDSVGTLEQMQNSKTGVDIARQNVQQVRFNQQYANIVAPADGFVVKKLSNEGEVIAPGTPVVVIASSSATGKWVLQLSVADRQWAAIPMGNDAVINIDAFPRQTFKGTVSKKSLSADPFTGSFQVEVRVNFNGANPAIGMFGTARITPAHSVVGFAIPYDALLEANGNKGFVFVSNDKKQVKKVSVSISRIDQDKVYISDGLGGYQYVVISGSSYLKDNSPIKVVQ